MADDEIKERSERKRGDVPPSTPAFLLEISSGHVVVVAVEMGVMMADDVTLLLRVVVFFYLRCRPKQNSLLSRAP